MNISKEKLEKVVKDSFSKKEIFKHFGLPIRSSSYLFINRIIKNYNLDVSHFYYEKGKNKEAGSEAFEKIVKGSFSKGEVLKKMKLMPRGGNYKTIDRKIKKYNIDTSHFKRIINNHNWDILKDELEKHVKESFSKIAVLKKINPNLALNSNNYKNLDNKIREYGFNTSHFTGAGHNKGKKFARKRPISDYLTNKVYIHTYKLKERLLEEKIFAHKCYSCNHETWIGEKIPLELHHKDGINDNHGLDNLILLCPNCHALTKNYRGKKIRMTENKTTGTLSTEAPKQNFIYAKNKNRNKKSCKCGALINPQSSTCLKCHALKSRKVERPSKEQLKKDILSLGYVGTGKKYGVSDNAIIKWTKYLKMKRIKIHK